MWDLNQIKLGGRHRGDMKSHNCSNCSVPKCIHEILKSTSSPEPYVRLHRKMVGCITASGYFSPQLILQKSNGQFQRILLYFKVPEGVQHFPGGWGVQLFPGVSYCLFHIETHITCDFPGGPDPLSPPSGSALEHAPLTNIFETTPFCHTYTNFNCQ